MEGNKLCFMCCSFSTTANSNNACDNGNDNNEVISNNAHFKVFCEHLEEVKIKPWTTSAVDNDIKWEPVERFIADALLAVLSLSPYNEKLSVCSSCQLLIRNAMDFKERLKGAEERVYNLQLQLLKELKELQGHTEGFYGEMKTIGDTIQNSDKDTLKSFINQEGGRSKGWMKRDIELFRSRTVKVCQGLGSYEQQLKRMTLHQNATLSQEAKGSAHQGHKEEDSRLASAVEENDLVVNNSEFTSENVELIKQEQTTDEQDPLQDIDMELAFNCEAILENNDDDHIDLDDPLESSNDDQNYNPPPSKKTKRSRTSREMSSSLPHCSTSSTAPTGRDQPPLEFLLNKMGSKSVVVDGHLFTDRYSNANSTFQCSFRRARSCICKLIVFNYCEEDGTYNSYKIKQTHNHPPNPQKIFNSRVYNRVKETVKLIGVEKANATEIYNQLKEEFGQKEGQGFSDGAGDTTTAGGHQTVYNRRGKKVKDGGIKLNKEAMRYCKRCINSSIKQMKEQSLSLTSDK